MSEPIRFSEADSDRILLVCVLASESCLRATGTPDRVVQFLAPLCGILTLAASRGVMARPSHGFVQEICGAAIDALTKDREKADALLSDAMDDIGRMSVVGDERGILEAVGRNDPLKACASCMCIAVAALFGGGRGDPEEDASDSGIDSVVGSIALSRACELLDIHMMEHDGRIVFVEGSFGAPIQ